MRKHRSKKPARPRDRRSWAEVPVPELAMAIQSLSVHSSGVRLALDKAGSDWSGQSIPDECMIPWVRLDTGPFLALVSTNVSDTVLRRRIVKAIHRDLRMPGRKADKARLAQAVATVRSEEQRARDRFDLGLANKSRLKEIRDRKNTAVNKLTEVFRDHVGILEEEDVVLVWRQAVAANIMRS